MEYNLNIETLGCIAKTNIVNQYTSIEIRVKSKCKYINLAMRLMRQYSPEA